MHSEAVLSGKVCPYCAKNSEYVDSAVVYGTSYGMIYYCADCRAYVGVHKGTDRALGRLANAELRGWKIKAHALFDKLWRKKMEQGFSKREARHKAYAWLSESMGIHPDLTHIGYFDVNECKQVFELCSNYFKPVS